MIFMKEFAEIFHLELGDRFRIRELSHTSLIFCFSRRNILEVADLRDRSYKWEPADDYFLKKIMLDEYHVDSIAGDFQGVKKGEDSLVPYLPELPYDEEIEEKWNDPKFARAEYIKYLKMYCEEDYNNVFNSSSSPCRYYDFISYSRRWDYGGKEIEKKEKAMKHESGL